MIFDSILFDLDDTLHDRNKSLSKFVDIFKQKFKHAIENDRNLNIKDIFFELDCRGYRPREEMFSELRNRIEWVFKPRLQELIDFWKTEFPKCAEPICDLYSSLDFFLTKNIKMGIVTNGDTLFQYAKIDKLDLRKYMKAIVISEEVKIRKPDKEIFIYALSKLQSKAETTLFVGDNPTIDIKGAIDSGLIPVWISNGEKWNIDSYVPRYTLNTFSEILSIC